MHARSAPVAVALLGALVAGCGGPEGPLGPRAARLLGDAEHLVGFGTRHVFSDENVEAAEWLADRLEQIGVDEVELQPFVIHESELRDPCPMAGPLTRSNVIATIAGTEEDGRVVLVGAHFDSMTDFCDPDAPAPGADDDASGTAALLEIARALVEEPPGRTVRIAAWNAEEPPVRLGGSGAYIDLVGDAVDQIAVVINLDMIGHPVDDAGRSIQVVYDPDGTRRENDAASLAWANRLVAHAEAEGLAPDPELRFILGFDCVPFEAAGVPCVGLHDGAGVVEMIHTVGDDASVLDAEYVARATAAALAVAREAADPTYLPPGLED